ncbi:MAG: HlyC/CorC family transporter [Prosthecobacter sp.]|jgi:CBS domain containing-hemolysin-like protein|uniref:hemolysin family protein n=1 Tax=Prosthecobacter sp. TaxID=1965333 RepID=UPI0019E70125|nr:hemolysin family protein [Prosthecobacter sp.]MBE2284373.1 HlyC/CorC family transporter [Prosthecobacter sp.]
MTLLLANAAVELAHEWQPDASYHFWRVVIILAIVLLNAFFVAAEFAIVKVRDSQLQAAIEDGVRGAKFARSVTRDLDAYLSAGQLGITLTSIALGIFGEPYVSTVLQPLLFKIGVSSEAAVSLISILAAYALVTYMHVVFGEQAPKVLAIRKSLTATLWIARPLHLFYVCTRPAIWLLSNSTNLVLRLFGITSVSEHEIAHSEEELRHIVAESQKSKEVTETEKDILLNALALNDRCVRDVMTPRNSVVSLDADDSFEANLKVAIDSKHTRYPLVEGHLDHAIGIIHIKDLLALVGKPQPDLRKIKRELHMVPELMPIDKLLRFCLDKHVHFVLAVDEFGGAVGVVTLDNVLEEIVGDIQDEFDHETSELRRISDDEFVVEGTLNLYELTEQTGIELESDEVTTIGGYVTHLLGHLPKVGETVTIEDYEVTTTKADLRRVQQLNFKRTSKVVAEAVED